MTTLNGGSLQGAISAPAGNIVTISTSGNGTIGTSATLRSTITCGGQVQLISAANIYADITIHKSNNDGWLKKLTTPGTFSGSLAADYLGAGSVAIDGLYVTGALDADVTFLSSTDLKMSIGSLPASRTIKTGTRLGNYVNEPNDDAPLLVTTGAGLAGQVIIDWTNTHVDPRYWWDSVRVGPAGNQVVLEPDPGGSAPYYPQTSAQLGGGAIGLVPFHLYATDCSPPDGTYLLCTQFEGVGAIVRYYGPVVVGDPNSPPIVQMRDPYNPDVWGDISPMFRVTVNPANVVGSARAVKVAYTGTAGRLAPGRYRLHLQAGGLVCSGVTDGPDAVGDYYFNIALDCNAPSGPGPEDFIAGTTWDPSIDCDRNGVLDTCDLAYDGYFRDTDHNGILDACQHPCPCDWNNSGTVNSQDFFDFLTSFFAGSADYNHDGVTNSQDFFDFLNCFFGGC